MNLHKLLFPRKERQFADLLLSVAKMEVNLPIELAQRDKENYEKGRVSVKPDEMENLMRASLGLPYIRFDNIEKDSKGNDNPPHYLSGMNPDQRLSYLSEMSQIFKKPEFKEVLNYHINVLGNHSIQKAKDEDMRNGRIGIIAIRGFRKEFEDANAEYMDSLKDPEEFDKHATLPE